MMACMHPCIISSNSFLVNALYQLKCKEQITYCLNFEGNAMVVKVKREEGIRLHSQGEAPWGACAGV